MVPLTRKWFIMAVLGTLVAALPVVAGAALKAPAGGQGHVFLELDGMPMGPLASFEGGMPFLEMVSPQLDANTDQVKRPSPVKYGDITVTFGSSMAKPLYQWMQDVLAKRPAVKSGAIVYADQNFNEVKRLTFVNALIAEIGFPALAVNEAKGPFLFTLRLSPELTRLEPGKGGKLSPATGHQKQVVSGNFRLSMPGIETQMVSKIEPLVAKGKIVAETHGLSRTQTKAYAAWETSDLVIEMPEGRGQGVGDWFYDFVVRGNNGPGKEKSATIELLDQTLKTTVLTISLNNLMILRLEPSKYEAGKETGRTIRATMHCEGMQFSVGGK